MYATCYRCSLYIVCIEQLLEELGTCHCHQGKEGSSCYHHQITVIIFYFAFLLVSLDKMSGDDDS